MPDERDCLSRPRVLTFYHRDPTRYRGGQESHLLAFARWTEAHLETTVSSGDEIGRTKIVGEKSFLSRRRVVSWLKDHSPDFVHLYGAHNIPQLQVANECRRQNIPVLLTPALHPPGDQPWRELSHRLVQASLTRPLLRAATLINPISKREAKRIAQIAPDTPLMTLPVGGGWSPEDVKSALTPDVDLPERFILFVGRNDPIKRIQSLVAAETELAQAGFGIVLVTNENPNLSQANKNIVVLTGMTDAQIPALYRQASATVLPSRSESFGIVMVESLSAGTPVIASQGVEALDWLPDHPGIITFDAHPREGDTPRISQCITNAVRSLPSATDEIRRQLQEIASGFLWSRVGEQYGQRLTQWVKQISP